MAQQPNRRKTQRRRRRRLVPIVGFIVVALGLAWFFESQMPTTFVFVRHADTAEPLPSPNDPPLSERGRMRAELLADVLQDMDVVAGVDAIYTSESKRAQDTAAPLAARLGLAMNVADPYRVEAFIARVLKEQKGKIVLVVTDDDIMAPLIEELHGSKNVPDMREDEYHNIYIVTRPRFGKVKTLRLHYGLPWPMPHDVPSSRELTDSL